MNVNHKALHNGVEKMNRVIERNEINGLLFEKCLGYGKVTFDVYVHISDIFYDESPTYTGIIGNIKNRHYGKVKYTFRPQDHRIVFEERQLETIRKYIEALMSEYYESKGNYNGD